MATSQIYGRMLDAYQIEVATIQVLTDFTQYYLREKERQVGREPGLIPLPKSITRVNSFSRAMLENQLPSIVVVSPGLAGPPLKDGRGLYRATWQLGIALINSAMDDDSTNEIVKIYSAALRLLMLQQKIDLEGFRGTTWIDENYDQIQPERSRNLSVGENLFEVEFENVSNGRIGPKTPTGDPLVAPPDYPVVGEGKADVSVTKL